MTSDLRALIEVDKTIHEPARLVVMAILSAVESADFLYLLSETHLTKGNLSSHLTRLEDAGYIFIEKTFAGKVPRTICRITPAGLEAFRAYREQIRTVID